MYIRNSYKYISCNIIVTIIQYVNPMCPTKYWKIAHAETSSCVYG